MKKILVTGGAGFIGSALVRRLIKDKNILLANIDKLTYAGNTSSIVILNEDIHRYQFVRGDIYDQKVVHSLINEFKPDVIMHLAAESHVDRSIIDPSAFIKTNVVGTYNLLYESLSYWNKLDKEKKEEFRFHHISTDEVFGALGQDGFFDENTAYDPSSPYSASKAGSDHLVRAWNRTYGLPTLITNCSNNYGPYQNPEKLIPLTIINAINRRKIPVYGNGLQVRDWLHVDDHVKGLVQVLEKGEVGKTYNIGGNEERTNLQVVNFICERLSLLESGEKYNYKNLIEHVEDRPGHDKRYAIDSSKIRNEIGWKPEFIFEDGLIQTIEWYLSNKSWWSKFST